MSLLADNTSSSVRGGSCLSLHPISFSSLAQNYIEIIIQKYKKLTKRALTGPKIRNDKIFKRG